MYLKTHLGQRKQNEDGMSPANIEVRDKIGILRRVEKASSEAALIYVHAHIKGLCTWLFPNHYRRTINRGPAPFDRKRAKSENKRMAESGQGRRGQDGKTDKANGSQYSTQHASSCVIWEGRKGDGGGGETPKQEIPH